MIKENIVLPEYRFRTLRATREVVKGGNQPCFKIQGEGDTRQRSSRTLRGGVGPPMQNRGNNISHIMGTIETKSRFMRDGHKPPASRKVCIRPLMYNYISSDTKYRYLQFIRGNTLAASYTSYNKIFTSTSAPWQREGQCLKSLFELYLLILAEKKMAKLFTNLKKKGQSTNIDQ